MRNKRFVMTIGCVLILGLVAMGCQTAGESAGGGALLGGLVGGIVGHQSGHAIEGAVAGAVVGGLAALVWHNYKTTKRLDAQQTAQHYEYTPDQGMKMDLRQMSLSPQQVEPGDKVTLTVEYATLGMGAGANVQEYSVLKYGGDPYSKLDERTVNRTDGTWVNTVQFEVPKNAELGNYMVAQELRAGNVTTSAQSSFQVVQKVAANQ